MLWGLICILVRGFIWGFATQTVIENKGYEENWFWWGFFFGIIALIVACSKPENTYYVYSNLGADSDKAQDQQLLSAGGWKCSCGRVHAAYVSSCPCGKSKSEMQRNQHNQAEAMDDLGKAAAIKAYKDLMDSGVITQEEFETKKQQLLGQ